MEGILARRVRLFFYSAIIFNLFFNYQPAFAGDDRQDDRQQEPWGGIYVTPTEKVAVNDLPAFVDDLDFEQMELALSRQLKRYEGKNMTGTIQLGQTKYPLGHVVKSLKYFKDMVDSYKLCKKNSETPDKSHCWVNFYQLIVNNFVTYRPKLLPNDRRYGEKDFTHFTAYYTPTLLAEENKTEVHQYSIYKKPKKPELSKLSREAIDFEHKLSGKNLEIAYTTDLFQNYILHVEGGGKLQFKDGTVVYLSYAGTNKKSWNFISKYMMAKGWITSLSIAAQRNYLRVHPEVYREVYSSCPSYVFFKESVVPPEGSDMVSLTDNRSIATDLKYYSFKGLLSFVKSKRLKEEIDDFDELNPKDSDFKNFSRFMLDQDTGGAIKGKARVDLYYGESEYAQRAAENQNHLGQLYFLMLKYEK